jgi:hypothetical protein
LDLAKKNYPSNITLTMDHTDNAGKLVYDIYFTDDNIVDDNDFIKRYDEVMNSSSLTTYALVVADLLDSTLREYANAIVTDIDLTNMSNLVLLDEAKNITIIVALEINHLILITPSSFQVITLYLIMPIMKRQ